MPALYNEIDEFAASWLEQLISAGQIAPGVVDRRSIEDLDPDYVRRFRQVHLFAGIGVWSHALRRAGWSDDRPVWTASCPCQPFSAAGKGAGFADERHLWPAMFHLIGQLEPDVVLGEQVSSKDGLAWFDLVSADMERAGYAVGALDTCAAGAGAPHIRQRLYWVGRREGVGHAHNTGLEVGRRGPDELVGAQGREAAQRPAGLSGVGGGLAAAKGSRRTDGTAFDGSSGSVHAATGEIVGTGHRVPSGPEWPGPTNGLWRAVDWLACRDGKWRPVEPGTFPLAHAGAYRNRVGLLRGAGNAINLAQAQGFIEAVM